MTIFADRGRNTESAEYQDGHGTSLVKTWAPPVPGTFDVSRGAQVFTNAVPAFLRVFLCYPRSSPTREIAPLTRPTAKSYLTKELDNQTVR